MNTYILRIKQRITSGIVNLKEIKTMRKGGCLMFSYQSFMTFLSFSHLISLARRLYFIRIKILFKNEILYNISHTSAGAQISLEQLVFMEPLRSSRSGNHISNNRDLVKMTESV